MIRRLNTDLAPFRILTGMEVDILEDGSLDLDDDLLAQLDVVVGSVHSKLRMERSDMTRRMVLAVSSPHVDILGHCTGRKLRSRGEQVASDTEVARPPSQFDAEIVFAACARFDTAVEINCRPERQDPPDELLELALEWECKIAIDTDAHAPGQMEWQLYGCEKAARHEIDLEQIVNTWDRRRPHRMGCVPSHGLTVACAWAARTAEGSLARYVEEDLEAQDERSPQAGEPRQQAERRP